MSYIVRQIVPKEIQEDIRKIIPEHKDFKLKVFDTVSIDFLNDFSRLILSDKTINKIPAIAALAFWLRKSSINDLINENEYIINSKSYRANPLGVVFHVCPSNVDVMFMYSLTIAFLTGNKNVVRVSKRSLHPAILSLFACMNNLLNENKYEFLKDYIKIVTYDHESEINEAVSSNCDVRIIWGGDQTINLFKTYKTKPTTKDLVFADRISFSLIKTSEYKKLDEKSKKQFIWDFFNDSYTFDQKGCSSPQTLLLLGSGIENNDFLTQFYNDLTSVVQENYLTDITSLASLKLNVLSSDVIDNKIAKVIHSNNYVTFAELLNNKVTEHSCGGGFFYIKNFSKIDSLTEMINKKIQTISYFGLSENEIDEVALVTNALGVDRIVPIGKTLQFNPIWDGYNLIDELVSKKYIQK